jgi:hypothetical protein
LSFGLRSNKFVHDFANGGKIGVKTELVANFILVHMAQGVAMLTFTIALRVELLNGRIHLFENFIFCDLYSFDAILSNTFLDVYEIDIQVVEIKSRFALRLALS